MGYKHSRRFTRKWPPVPHNLTETLQAINQAEKVTPLDVVRLLLINTLGDAESANKVRECLVCGILFWAHRKDAQQCGNLRCKSTLASRLMRERQKRESI